jgi:hypothetical protein
MPAHGSSRTPFRRIAGDRIRALVLVVALTLTLVAAPATALPAVGKPRPPFCLDVSVTGVGRDLGSFRTEGELYDGGARVATTQAAFTPLPQPGSVLSFEGPLVVTPTRVPGTITVQLVGTVDLTTGHFTATSAELRGSGPLHDVTGTLVVDGVQPGSTFTETVTGTLCIAAARERFLVQAFTAA